MCGTQAPVARADGDPASDYLLAQQVFFPYDAELPARQQAEFAGLVAAANRAGFEIRVALIGSRYDMGSVTALYGKPRLYARFLGEELSLLYKRRLLVVMPDGFGLNWPGHRAAPEYAVLDKISIGPGQTGLLAAATTAVRRLTAAAGVEVATPAPVTARAQRNSYRRVLLFVVAALAAAAALPLVVGARFALRRRRRQVR